MSTIIQRMVITAVISLCLITVATAIEQLLGLYDFVKADVLRVEENTVILGNGCKAIVAETSQERAESIRLGIAKRIDQRPNTHDTFVQAIKTFNITVDSLRLVRFDGSLYYADLVLKSKDKVLKLDVRPSDGIAIAIRADAPIYINQTLLEEKGENIC